MTSFAQLVDGGESGRPAIVPNAADESYLVELITIHNGESEMPKNAPPLSEAEIDLIKQWISSGAANDSSDSARPAFDQDNPPHYIRPPIVTAMDVSPDGSLIAISGFHEVLVHRTDGTGLVARLIGTSERIESLRFSPDGHRLAVTGGIPARMGEVQVWDVEDVNQGGSAELLLSKPMTFDSVYGAAWSPDGQLIAFGCTDTSVRAINAETGEQVLFQGAHDDWILDTTFSRNGDHLVSVGRDMTAKLTEVETQRFVDNITSITPKALKGGIQAVVTHPLRDEIIFGGADGVPKIYQMHRTTKRQIGDDANQLWQLPSLPGRIFSVDIDAAGRRIVAGSSLNGVGHIHVYEMDAAPVIPADIKDILKKPTHTRSQQEISKLERHFADGVKTLGTESIENGGIYAVAISPDGKTVFAAGRDGVIHQLESQNGQIERKFVPVDLHNDRDDGNLAAQNLPNSVEAEIRPNAIDVKQIESLSLTPTNLEFSSDNESAQIVVTARMRDGKSIDVTRNVDWQVDQESVQVSSHGFLTPVADGTAQLTAQLGDHVAECQIVTAGIESHSAPDYIQDVNPVLSKVGCNAGTCHGAKDGKNGFKLSLRGYDPLYDVRALADDLASRRVNLAVPAQSMILQKSTAAAPHEGGQVIVPGSSYYRTLHDWIANGATLDRSVPRVSSIDVYPSNPVIETIGDRQQVRVVATYRDGSRRDVTRESFVESNNTDIVERDSRHAGLMHALRRGEAAILVRYEGAYAATTLTVMGDRSEFVWEEPEKHNQIDHLVAAKLQRTKTMSAPLCDDYTFLRRVSLDLTGLPPTPEEIQRFVSAGASGDRTKRDQVVDRLIGSPDFVEYWTNKWSDLLQVNGKYLARDGAVALRAWIRQHVAVNTPYDQFVKEILTATGSTKDNPAAAYYKILRTPEETLENTTHLFLATRFNCNKCHDHPFERWTQDQYYQLGAFFAQVGRRADPRIGDKQIGRTQVEAGKPFYEIVYDAEEGELQHDRTGELTPPQFPFDCKFEEPQSNSRRALLAAWVTSADNPYFARSYVNRLWGYLTGRGIIEPIDDIRAGNPPTNPELLEYLTQEFIDSHFDTQHILRLICSSRTYQLSVETNRWNEDDTLNYSHAKPRRLTAEALYDAIHRVTGSVASIPNLPVGVRAASLPDAGIKLPDGFLGNFGRPARESACECERTTEMQLGPVMALISGPTVGNAINNEHNQVRQLADETQNDRQLVDQLYLRIINRPATPPEIDAALSVFRDVDADHERVVAALGEYQSAITQRLEDLERQRVTRLQEAQQALADYEQQQTETLAKKEAERTAAIEEIEQKLASRRDEILANLPRWESERKNQTRWTPLDPIELSSSNNSPLKREVDLKIYAEARGNDAIYNIVAQSPLKAITGIRVEAISDKRLRQGGPGHNFDGNFVLTEFEAAYAPQDSNQAVRLDHWDFSSDTDDWAALVDCEIEHADGLVTVTSKSNTASIVADVEAPAGPKALEIVADVDNFATIEVLWRSADDENFSHQRKASLRVAEGPKAFRKYVIYFDTDKPITALRIDPDDRATTIRIDSMSLVQLSPPEFEAIKFEHALADFSEAGYHVETAIDGETPNIDNGWGIGPQTNQDHVALFGTDRPIGDGRGALKIIMKHFYKSKEHQIALFRLSVTDDPRALTFGLSSNIGEIVDTPVEQRTSEQRDQLVTHVERQDDMLRALQQKLANTKKPLPTDEQLVKLKAEVARYSKAIPPEPKLEQLKRAVELSQSQLAQRRLTAAQDLAWALINSPAFLYNH